MWIRRFIKKYYYNLLLLPHSLKQQQYRSTTIQHQHSFTTRVIPEENSLPATMAKAGSISEFKSQLVALVAEPGAHCLRNIPNGDLQIIN